MVGHVYKNINYALLNDKPFLVKEISAVENIHLEECIRWLFSSISDFNRKKEENYQKNKNKEINV